MDDVDLAMRLADRGVDLDVIADALDAPLDQLREVSRTTRLTPEDQQLASAMRQLAWKAWREAMWILDDGAPDARMAIVKSVLAKVGGLIGEERTSTYSEAREAISRMWAEMRDVNPAEPPRHLPVPEGDTDAEPAAPPGRAVHTDKIASRDPNPVRPGSQPDRR